MKKADLVLIAITGLVALLLAMVCHSWGEGAQAVVYVDGVRTEAFDLSRDTEYEIAGVDGHNALVIEDGGAYLSDADCPDKLCVKMGRISKEGESIICLPHRVVVEIEGGKENEVDVVVK